MITLMGSLLSQILILVFSNMDLFVGERKMPAVWSWSQLSTFVHELVSETLSNTINPLLHNLDF